MSGIGRGRGWLNINKNKEITPGIPNTEEISISFDSSSSSGNSLKSNGKYANVLSKFSLFNENDDGISLNMKIKDVHHTISTECTSFTEVEEACTAVYEHCLEDEEFQSKVIGIISALSFNKIIIHDVKIRNVFIAKLQEDFERRKQLQMTNPKMFRLVIKFLGEYYHKAKLSDGQRLQFMAHPLEEYLDLLLDSSSEADIQLFTIMLHLNGNNIRNTIPAKFMQLITKLRNTLAFNEKLSSTSKLWLMLAIDFSNNRFNFIPNELQMFYLSRLGENAMSQLKMINTNLSIHTKYPNSMLDSIQSNVKVLQQVTETAEKTQQTNKTDNFNAISPETDFNNGVKQKFEKTPRPILGAGVHLKQAEHTLNDEELKGKDLWKKYSSKSWDFND